MQAVAEVVRVSEVLAEKLRERSARVGIVGFGYVGLPLAVEFAKAGFAVTGIDFIHVLENASLVVDTRNALKGVNSDKIVRL